jgi:chemotaxis protein CheX
MNQINSLDIKTFVANAIHEVFDTMLSLEVELNNADLQEPTEGRQIAGSVSFAGKVMGSLNIQLNDNFARIMTAAMLGMELDKIESDEEVRDVIGELCNIIGGDLKSRLCDAGFACQLSIPCITSGNHFRIESKDWARKERLEFRHQEHIALVEIYIKLGE